LAKEHFPTVRLTLKKGFDHSLLLCPPLAKTSSKSGGDKPEINVVPKPHFARISRCSCGCHKCKTSLGAFSLQ